MSNPDPSPALTEDTVFATPRPSSPSSGWKTLAPWYATEFTMSYSISLYATGSYFFAEHELHATPAERLWLSAAFGAVYILASLLAGHLTEKWGPKTLAIRMTLLSTLAGFLSLAVIYYPPLHNMWGLFLAMNAVNFTGSQCWPALESATTRSPAKMRLSTRITCYNMSWGAASFVAVFTAPLFFHINWSLIFIIPAAVSLLAAYIVTFIAIPQSMLSPRHVESHTEEIPNPPSTLPSTPPSTPAPALQLRRNTLLFYMALLSNAMCYVAINVLSPVLPTIAKNAHATPGLHTSLIISGWSFTRALGFLIVWLWSGWHFSVSWLIGTFLAMVASFVLILALPNNVPLLLSSEFLFGLTIALLYSASLYYAMHVSAGSGSHAGLHEALIGLGIAIGPAVGAAAGTTNQLNQISPPIILAVTTVLTIGFVILSILGLRAGPQTPIGSETQP